MLVNIGKFEYILRLRAFATWLLILAPVYIAHENLLGLPPKAANTIEFICWCLIALNPSVASTVKERASEK